MKHYSIFIGADHAGFELKEKIKRELLKQKISFTDVTPKYAADDDYPAIGKAVAKRVASKKDARGILVCGSGVGISIAANRQKGARAFDAHSIEEVKLAREHNDANIIALSGWNMNLETAAILIKTFFHTPFSKATRHRRRVKQLE
jgi:ribose 5-phosphate isomerase B